MSEIEAMCAKAVAVAEAKNSLQGPGSQQVTPMMLEGNARGFPERTNFTILDQLSQFSSVQYFIMLSRLVMEKAMATYSSTLPWKIPWAEEPGRLQSMGSLRVRHD